MENATANITSRLNTLENGAHNNLPTTWAVDSIESDERASPFAP
ncbi:hypothetical protein FF011L_08340 [Roseimaritima multifibrata]|uniref:Uncharacterized protein n=1 Tax=Roseimaritima multifibrata TaxID=1930274 RepID=A0A517MB37_9BACT|nr:hypothetical protein FF011L_08340 [Roseimaritima multifibrata]